MGDAYPELRDRLGAVRRLLELEESAFLGTLDKGLKVSESWPICVI